MYVSLVHFHFFVIQFCSWQIDSVLDCPAGFALHSYDYVANQFQQPFIKQYEKNKGNLDSCFPTWKYIKLCDLKTALNDFSPYRFRIDKTRPASTKKPTTVEFVCDKSKTKGIKCPVFAHALATDQGWLITKFDIEHNHEMSRLLHIIR